MRSVVIAFGIGVFLLRPAAADDFTFKTVKVGDIAPGKRITVQIDPVEQAKALEAWAATGQPAAKATELPPVDGNAVVPLAPVAAGASKYGWFWDKVPAGLAEADGRFQTALLALNAGPDGTSVAQPRLQALQSMAADYGTEILRATVGTEVSPALVLAVMSVESGGNASAKSSAGAQGLMQLIPATAARFGVTDAFDAGQNIRGGVAYLDWLMGNFNRDPLMVIAAYNSGEGAVTANGGVPPYAETRDYVPKVLAAWSVAQGLCLTPPMLMSDPCVFNVVSAQR
jgi:soluble lytic murein transglycosylase-like protein